MAAAFSCRTCNNLCDTTANVCVICKNWFHAECSGLSSSSGKDVLIDNMPFICLHCCLIYPDATCHLTYSNPHHPNGLHDPDSQDPDINVWGSCKYYNVIEMAQVFKDHGNQGLSVIHVNIRSLAKNILEL